MGRMNWHDNFGTMLFYTFVFIFFIGCIVYSVTFNGKCITACGNDPLIKCEYRGAVCASRTENKIYVVGF